MKQASQRQHEGRSNYEQGSGLFRLNTALLSNNLRTAQSGEDAIQHQIDRALAANCLILVQASGESWEGSGFHLGGGLVATASHVCPPEMRNKPSQIILTFDGRTPFPATVIASTAEYDSAILYSPHIARAIPAVQLADSDQCKRGDTVAVIGCPDGFLDTATVGRITNIHQGLGAGAPTPAWKDCLMIDAEIHQGASGGMVINEEGLVVGSVMGISGQNADKGVGEEFVCPSNKIKKLIDMIREGH